MKFQLLPSGLLEYYFTEVPSGLECAFDELEEAQLSNRNFSFYTSVASVFSSKIEGERIELDSYIKHKRDNIPFLPDYTKKIDDLYDAYLFAQQNQLNEENLKQSHRLLSRSIVSKEWRGRYRMQPMYVATEDGKIEYVAALPQQAAHEMGKFFADIEVLLKTPMTVPEAFFYASMIHLVFVKIHLWNDGNGRNARLLEKWFLAEKLGSKAWLVQSEKMYYQNHQSYYHNIRALGLEYDHLIYDNALNFLLMLPASVVQK